MDAVCFPLIRGRVFRLTALDRCGRRLATPCSSIVSDGIVTAAISSRTQEGETITVVSSSGRRIVDDQGEPTFTGHGVELTFGEVNPLLLGMITANKVVYNPDTGVAVGFRTSTKVKLANAAFALEVWMDVPGVVCDLDDEEAQGSWGYVVIPFLSGGVLGDFSVGNDAVNFTVTGATTKDSSGWGVGPYNVVLTNGVPTPLWEPMEAHEPLHIQVTNYAPPEPGCSCEANGDPATFAVSGTPGTFGPSDTYGPEDYAGIQALVMPSRTVTDGATTSGSTTVSSATAAFTTSDVGAKITGAGIPANATIVSRTSATAVVISAAATATAAGVSVTVTQSQPWTAGQYIEAANGDEGYWNGTAWAVGRKP